MDSPRAETASTGRGVRPKPTPAPGGWVRRDPGFLVRHDFVAGWWAFALFGPNRSCGDNLALSRTYAGRWMVVGAERITSVDVTSADVLVGLDRTLHQAGMALCFAEMKGQVKDELKRFGLFSRLDEQRFFATVGEAVNRYLESQSVKWVDWEDRAAASVHESAQEGRTEELVGSQRQAG